LCEKLQILLQTPDPGACTIKHFTAVINSVQIAAVKVFIGACPDRFKTMFNHFQIYCYHYSKHAPQDYSANKALRHLVDQAFCRTDILPINCQYYFTRSCGATTLSMTLKSTATLNIIEYRSAECRSAECRGASERVFTTKKVSVDLASVACR